MSCSIDDINAGIEEKTPSGLLKNHAYSLINFHKLEKELLLVKLRNVCILASRICGYLCCCVDNALFYFSPMASLDGKENGQKEDPNGHPRG